jgi:sarcosine oxidase
VEVTCYERATVVMNERSAGSSRIFRLAHGSAELVALAQSAGAGFRRWARDAGTPLLTTCGCVVSGPEAPAWAAAMERAGARWQMVQGACGGLRLPAVDPPAEALVDPAGAVIDVDAVRAHLTALTCRWVVHEPVYALETVPSGAVVWSVSGHARFDVVVVAAGAGTSPLVAQVGLYTPCALAHHVRFGFPAPQSAGWQCWIDTPAVGLGTYQHRGGPGRWSIGGHLDPALTTWEVGREAAAEVAEQSVLRYARERLTVEPRIVERLYCTTTPGLGDGFTVRRTGSVLAVYGENLFKFAPVLGDLLAAACRDGSAPCAPMRERG